MLTLLNTTKTMRLEGDVPGAAASAEPAFLAEARALAERLRRLDRAELARLMDLSPALADATRRDLALWGTSGRPTRPALFAFTGLVYQSLDPGAWTAAQRRRAQGRLRILSGLYGLLRPLDPVEAYRLEMGCRFRPPGAPALTAFWKPRLTAALDAQLKPREPVLNLAAKEYVQALDLKALGRPVISPVFKERRPDGSLKNAPVYAKQARGALAAFVITEKVERPAELAGFGAGGWEAAGPVPTAGDWLFTRPARG